jgi:hypothetical protein
MRNPSSANIRVAMVDRAATFLSLLRELAGIFDSKDLLPKDFLPLPTSTTVSLEGVNSCLSSFPPTPPPPPPLRPMGGCLFAEAAEMTVAG